MDDFDAAVTAARQRAPRVAKHTEQQLWHVMRDNLLRVNWDRIENSVTTGISDLIGTKNGRVVWVELKVFEGNKIHFQKTQPAWIYQKLAAGGNVYILARNLERLLLYEGKQLRRLIEARVATVEGASIRGRADAAEIEAAALLIISKPFDWCSLENALFPRPRTEWL
jgi:Holliday junction resolvase